MSDTYYILDYDTNNTKLADTLSKPEIVGEDDIELDLGTKFLGPLPTIKFTMTKEEYGELGDLVFTTFPGILLSEKFKQTLDASGIDNIDYYPATVEDAVKNITHDNYYIANIIGKINCMDMGKSEYTERPAIPGTFISIENLVVDHSKIHAEKIFRFASYSSIIFVREDIKTAIEKADLVGIEFFEADGFETD